MKLLIAAMVAAAPFAFAAAQPTDATPQAAVSSPVDGIAWVHTSNNAEVDAAFARAKAENKPVFVYWGASWCPPCNQVKATLFNRRDFIERSRAFLPVYVDGDSPGAQRIGARFHVSGYPTLVMFEPSGTEITRLPGEVEGARYTQLLAIGLDARRPAKAVLAQALAAPAGLSTEDWRLLALYAWDVDEQQLVPKNGRPAMLQRLADTCPAANVEPATRLRLLALAARDAKAPPLRDAGTVTMLQKLLGDPAASRAHLDLLTNDAPEIVRAVSASHTPARASLRDAFGVALQQFSGDASLSNADRLQALNARVDLARLDAPAVVKQQGAIAAPPPALPAALLAEVRAQAARVDRDVTDGYERQAVIPAAADLLQDAGLDAESDTLLRANLTKSHAPYYLMSELAANAKRRADNAEALRWSHDAFEASEGPATRLQWGSSYLRLRTELAPTDEAAIEQLARRLLDEASRQPDAFYERSGRSLARAGSALVEWNKGGAHAATLQRLRSRLNEICAALPADPAAHERCTRLLVNKPASAGAA